MNEKSPSQLSKYRILGLVGRGQFGKVLCARMRDTDKLVALKELENKRFPTSKLLRELRFLLTLRHENIVACSSLVHHQNYRYLVMDYCEGGTLRDLMNYARALSVKQCFDLVNDILLGLEHAHAANIIHCDIKPENILLKITAQGWQAKISDFGISRLSQEVPTDGASNTGSPGYMAPERFYGQFSIGSDIYAVGIMLYEILVGKRPFTGMPMDLMNAHINQRIVFPDTLPRSLQAIITRALEKLPQRRYLTAEEMRLDLLDTIRREDFSHTQTGLSAELCTTILFAQKAPHFAQQDLAEKVLSLAPKSSSQFYSASSLHLYRHSLPIAPELEISKVKYEFRHELQNELQHEFQIQAIASVQQTLFIKTDHGIYQCDGAKSKQIYKSTRSFDWVISPSGDWFATSTGKQLEIRNLVYGRSMRLEFSSRELSCIIAFDRHHLVAIANKPETQESRAMVISRRGNIMYRLELPIPINYGVATFTRDRVLLREAENHKNIFLLDLNPYRLARIPLEYDVLIMVATTWGYAIAAKYNVKNNAKNNEYQTILILLDLSGHNISNLIIDGEVTAIAPIDMSLLAIAVSEISGHKLYAINLKKLEIDLVF